MSINFISSKTFNKVRNVSTKSDNKEIMIDDETAQMAEKLQ